MRAKRRDVTIEWANMEVDVAKAVEEWVNIEVDIAKAVDEWANIKTRTKA